MLIGEASFLFFSAVSFAMFFIGALFSKPIFSFISSVLFFVMSFFSGMVGDVATNTYFPAYINFSYIFILFGIVALLMAIVGVVTEYE
jgi:hypothetical protein